MPQEYDFSHHLSPSVVSGAMSFDIASPVPQDDNGNCGLPQHEHEDEPVEECIVEGTDDVDDINNYVECSIGTTNQVFENFNILILNELRNVSIYKVILKSFNM